MIKPTLSITIKNTYLALLLVGMALYASGIAYGQSSLHQHKLDWIERTVEYQQLNQISDRAARSDRWDILHALDNLATDQLWVAFGNFLLLVVVGTLLFLLGYGKIVFVVWPAQEKRRQLDLQLKNAQLAAMSHKPQSWVTRVARWFHRK